VQLFGEFLARIDVNRQWIIESGDFFRAFAHLTRSLAVARIADRTSCHWPSTSSRSDNFHFIW